MKNNLNVIQIRGIKGLIVAGVVLSCLFAGFVIFPGIVMMYAWNYIASFTGTVPTIGIFQGLLLWGIMVASYFTFRKNKLVVCFKSPQGLSEEELKSVFADIKKQAEEDPVLKAMLKAREAEFKLQAEKLNNEIKEAEEAETLVKSEHHEG